MNEFSPSHFRFEEKSYFFLNLYIFFSIAQLNQEADMTHSGWILFLTDYFHKHLIYIASQPQGVVFFLIPPLNYSFYDSSDPSTLQP